jgi:hypothetical protein
MAIDKNFHGAPRHGANAKMRVQSFFVPITIPPFPLHLAVERRSRARPGR